MRPSGTARRLRLLLAAFITGGALAGACGRKTPVRPPEFVAPAAITALRADNAATAIRLTWKRPGATADGGKLFDLASFVVERAVGGAAFAVVGNVPVTDRDRLRQQRSFQFSDQDVNAGESYRYRVHSLTLDGYQSAPSNVVEIVRQVPTVTPTGAPTATPTAVTID